MTSSILAWIVVGRVKAKYRSEFEEESTRLKNEASAAVAAERVRTEEAQQQARRSDRELVHLRGVIDRNAQKISSTSAWVAFVLLLLVGIAGLYSSLPGVLNSRQRNWYHWVFIIAFALLSLGSVGVGFNLLRMQSKLQERLAKTKVSLIAPH